MQVIVLAVLAGLCWGIGEIFTKSVLHTKAIDPFLAIAIRTTVALPILWIVAIAFGSGRGDRPPMDTALWLKLILGSGVMAGAAGMILFYAALNAGEISRVKPIAFTVAPAAAVVLGWIFLGEPLSPRKLTAVGLVLAGVVLLASGSTPASAPEAHSEQHTPE